MQTLLLDTLAWDLVLDVNGDIAVASEPYSLAQDVASYVQTFLGELWLDSTFGLNYAAILGQSPTPLFLKSQIEALALKVTDVSTVDVVLSSFENRVLTGQIQITSTSGTTSSSTFTVTIPQGV